MVVNPEHRRCGQGQQCQPRPQFAAWRRDGFGGFALRMRPILHVGPPVFEGSLGPGPSPARPWPMAAGVGAGPVIAAAPLPVPCHPLPPEQFGLASRRHGCVSDCDENAAFPRPGDPHAPPRRAGPRGPRPCRLQQRSRFPVDRREPLCGDRRRARSQPRGPCQRRAPQAGRNAGLHRRASRHARGRHQCRARLYQRTAGARGHAGRPRLCAESRRATRRACRRRSPKARPLRPPATRRHPCLRCPSAWRTRPSPTCSSR